MTTTRRRTSYPNNGTRRAEDGCILTFENAKGDRLTLHRTGSPTKTLGYMLDEALFYDDTYRVISYSTPETIWTDMNGGRVLVTEAQAKNRRITSPELTMLSRVGREEMLHPRMIGSMDERERRNNKQNQAENRARRRESR